MKYFASILLALFIFQKSYPQDAKIFQSDKLEKLWETPKELQTPESVCFDIANQVLYVSNINGKLYVTDIDRVAVINIKNKSIEQFFEFPEAKFLNDIAIDKSGIVYISDMMSNRIYRIFQNKAELWLEDKTFINPNGLYVDNNKLMVGCNKIVQVDINEKSILPWLENTGGIDGLKGIGGNRYVFSDWTGNVYLVNEDREIEKILDLSVIGLNAADIEILPEKNIIYVPTFNGNMVIAYQLK